MSASLGQFVLILSHSLRLLFLLRSVSLLQPLSSSALGHVLLWRLNFLCRGKVSLLASLNGFYDGLDMIVSLYISLSVKVYLTQLLVWQALYFWMSSAATWYLDKSVKCLFLRPLNAAFSSFVLSFTRCIEIIQSQAQEEGDTIKQCVTLCCLGTLNWQKFSVFFFLRRVGGIVSMLNGKITFDTAFLLRSKKLSAKADTLPLTYLSWQHFLDAHFVGTWFSEQDFLSSLPLPLLQRHSPSFSSLLW